MWWWIVLLIGGVGCTRAEPVEPVAVEPAVLQEAVTPPAQSVPAGFASIPPGRYLMGSPETEPGRMDNEGPTHAVRISRPFLLARTEVTVRQFREFVEATGYVSSAETAGVGGADNGNTERRGLTWKNPPFPQGEHHPVVEVSWHDAVAYADWRSSLDGLPTCYADSIAPPGCRGWRLPTEAEWERAARAGTTTPFSVSVSGEGCEPDAALAAIAWTCANSGGATHAVGGLAPNAWGLHDMHGNVWEWTHDWFDDYQAADQVDPVGPSNESDKVIRGGGWGSRAKDCRAAVRVDDPPGKAFDNLGFRLARTAP